MIVWFVILLVIAVADLKPVPSLAIGGGSYLVLFWSRLK
jgi:hypothetical protein